MHSLLPAAWLPRAKRKTPPSQTSRASRALHDLTLKTTIHPSSCHALGPVQPIPTLLELAGTSHVSPTPSWQGHPLPLLTLPHPPPPPLPLPLSPSHPAPPPSSTPPLPLQPHTSIPSSRPNRQRKKDDPLAGGRASREESSLRACPCYSPTKPDRHRPEGSACCCMGSHSLQCFAHRAPPPYQEGITPPNHTHAQPPHGPLKYLLLMLVIQWHIKDTPCHTNNHAEQQCSEQQAKIMSRNNDDNVREEEEEVQQASGHGQQLTIGANSAARGGLSC